MASSSSAADGKRGGGGGAAFYCVSVSNSSISEPACSRRRSVHHTSSLFLWLLLGTLALLICATLTSATTSCTAHSSELCSSDSFCDAKSATMSGDCERERTFIMIKPDGVHRGLVGEILKRFEQKGFRLVAMKFMWADKPLLEKHYADLAARPFFPGLVKYMSSGPVVPMVWEGTNVVKTGRQMLGETNPAASLPGTIRGDFCIEVGRNICHGSDSVESAKNEIALWFKPEELVKWKSVEDPWLYE